MFNFSSFIMRILPFITILAIIILSEYYFIQAIKTFSQDFLPTKRNIFKYAGIVLVLLDVAVVLTTLILGPPHASVLLRFTTGIVFILILCKVFCFLFLFPEDLVRFVRWVISKF